MAHFKSYIVVLDGTNDQTLVISSPVVSITVWGDTSSVQLSVRPGDGNDFMRINTGGSLTLGDNQAGELLEPLRLTLRAASALTVNVLVEETLIR